MLQDVRDAGIIKFYQNWIEVYFQSIYLKILKILGEVGGKTANAVVNFSPSIFHQIT